MADATGEDRDTHMTGALIGLFGGTDEMWAPPVPMPAELEAALAPGGALAPGAVWEALDFEDLPVIGTVLETEERLRVARIAQRRKFKPVRKCPVPVRRIVPHGNDLEPVQEETLDQVQQGDTVPEMEERLNTMSTKRQKIGPPGMTGGGLMRVLKQNLFSQTPELRRKSQNEFCLEETAKALMLGTGEPAVANHIVGYVQDYFRLESLGRIEESNCARDICMELKKLLDANVADEAYVKAFLSKLEKLVGELEPARKFVFAQSLRKLFQNDGMNLVVQCMNMYPNSESVTLHGSYILAGLSVGLGLDGVLAQDEVDEIYPFLISDSCMMTVIGTLKNHQDNQVLLWQGMIRLSYLGTQIWCKRRLDSPSLGLQAMYLQQLEQKNVIPLCWDLLQKQIRWDKPKRSDAFCSLACYVLTLNVGGKDRPILKKLLAEAPQETVDAIISRTRRDIGIRAIGHPRNSSQFRLYERARLEFRMLCQSARAQV